MLKFSAAHTVEGDKISLNKGPRRNIYLICFNVHSHFGFSPAYLDIKERGCKLEEISNFVSNEI